ncbi:MAG: nicotinate phosphoribosyltransferase, partial [Pygmaiobacter sp.]
MDVKQSRNLTMLTDFYEITMAAGYFEEDYKEKICVFDMFFRKVPDGGGFAICAGVEQLVEALANLKFTEEDLEYLRGCNCFSEQFISYLRELKFTCDIWAIPEGTPIFPGEPIVTVEGPAIQAQLIETLLLVNMNHQSLIATKSSRICRAAGNRPVAEFGARRAQSYDAAVYGARAAYIGGVASTSCVFAARDFGIPASGTMAHSWVQMFPSELDAFKKYAELYPTNCILLVDTYNVIKSGIPNALRVFEEVLKPLGIRPKGVRIDSGDIAYLSKIARKMLDASGYEDVMIVASNSLDEYIVRDLLLQDAKVDSFGIGENLITSKSDPVFGGVYKLAAVKDGEQYIPKIKVSESVEKLTTPHRKSVWRIFDKRTGKALADYITIFDEVIDPTADITIFDPIETWKSKTFTNCTVQKIQVQLFDK